MSHSSSDITPQNYDRTSYILVVDDDNTLLKFFKIHLNKFFSRVIVVQNGKEALEVVREKSIDLVLTDFNMPRMDGLGLLSRMRKQDATIPVLLISGANLSEQNLSNINEQADGYLRKPFSVEELHEFISLGVEMREIMVKLSGKLNKKQMTIFQEIAAGQCDLPSVIKRKADLPIIQDLVEDLKNMTLLIKSIQNKNVAS